MYELVLTVTTAIIFLCGWNASNYYREYTFKKLKEKEQIVNLYKTNNSRTID